MKKSQLSLLSGTLFFAFFASEVYPQSQNWLWAKTAQAASDDRGVDVATDQHGNVYVTGFFSAYSFNLGTVTLNCYPGNQQNSNMFLVKYDPDGNVLWARSAGSSGGAGGTSVATDFNGNVYLCGQYRGRSLTFDIVSGSTYTIQSGNTDSTYGNMFLMKYSPAGKLIWAKTEGADYYEQPQKIDVDKNGNLFVTGNFLMNTNLSGIILNAAVADQDIFIAKYDSAGNIQWAHSAGTMTTDVAPAIGTDDSGNVFISGSFGAFGPMYFGSTTISSAGLADVYTAKYNSSGALVWVRSMGGPGPDMGYGLSVDKGGHVYVSGTYRKEPMVAGSFTLNNSTPGNEFEDVFLVKYSAAGDVLWARNATGYRWDYGSDVAADDSGNVYLTGTYESDTLTIGTTFIKIVGKDKDIFLAKYDSSGTFQWIKAAGGMSRDEVTALEHDRNGNVVIKGFFLGSSLPFGTITLNTASGTEMFIAKLATGGISTSTNEVRNENVVIYPNPVRDEFRFSGLSGEWNMKIFNMQGQKVLERSVHEGQMVADLPDQSAGVYFILLSNFKGEMKTGRLVKE